MKQLSPDRCLPCGVMRSQEIRFLDIWMPGLGTCHLVDGGAELSSTGPVTGALADSHDK